MYKLHKVDAVHDILKRVIKTDLKEDELNSLVDMLKANGYEEQNIMIECVHKIHQEGDFIAITKEQFESLPDDNETYWANKPVGERKKLTIDERKKANAKRSLVHIFGKNPTFPLKAQLQGLRLSNEYGHMIAVWENTPPLSELKHTNVHFLEDIGFEFEQPNFDVIPIAEAKDSLLNTTDKIVKYLINDNNWSEEQALDYLKPVLNAMNKAEAVFYQP